MKTLSPAQRAKGRGFTLIELLVVISIIGVLAGLLLPVLGIAKTRAKTVKAKAEIMALLTAINQYEGDYHRLPASDLARASMTDEVPDFTFGTYYRRNDGSGYRLMNGTGKAACPIVDNAPRRISYETSNAELISALADITQFRNGELTPNKAEHVLNPKKNPYLDLMAADVPKRPTDPARPGLGYDGVYRDPFGNPYIITLDLNYDGRCRDAFYRKQSVSVGGINGLSLPAGVTTGNYFEATKSVMVWSFGPDGMASDQLKANVPPNKDNILSWQ